MRTKLTAVMFFALLFHCTSGFAAIYGIDNLFLNPGFLAEVTPVKAQPLIGQYDLTFLGKEAAYNNSLLRMPGSEVIFKNSVTAVGETRANMDIACYGLSPALMALALPQTSGLTTTVAYGFSS